MNKQYLKIISTLTKKELMSYFNSPIAYIFISVFLVIANWLFFNDFFLIGQANMRSYFSLLPWIFLFLAPAVTMRLWSEEKKSRTEEFLLTLPITSWQAVWGKFIGALTFVIITVSLSLTIPVSVVALGNVDFGPIIGGYLGTILLAGSYLALGLFVSSLTKNQIIAFISALVFSFVFFIIGADFVLVKAPQVFASLMKFIGLGSHFYNIAKGVIDTKDVVYYVSFIFIFLLLNVRVIESRK